MEAIYELRERATVLRQGRWSDGEDDATLMEQAADTILELREMAQKANAENVKLRNLIELMRSCPGDKGECDECRRLNDGCEVERLSRELGIEV